MTKKKIEERVYKYATELLVEKGFVSPIDLLIKMDKITSKQVQDWRLKKIPYLERVTVGNLSKLNHILKTLARFAREQDLKSSITVYKSWGKGPKKTLRFSKTGNAYMEKLYSTHYVRKRLKK